MKTLSEYHAKKNRRKEEIRRRTKYFHHSQRFLDWVENLGFEQTRLGRLLKVIDNRFHLRRVAMLFIFCLVLSFLLFFNFDFSYQLQVNQVATTDIKSPISFQFVDEASTQSKRDEAEKAVKPVLDYDPDIYEVVFSHVYKAFRDMRAKVRTVRWPQDRIERAEKVKEFLQNKSQFEADLGVKVSPQVFEWLVENRFSAFFEKIVTRALVKWSNFHIVDSVEPFSPQESSQEEVKDEQLIVRELRNDGTTGDDHVIERHRIFDLRDISRLNFDGIRSVERLTQVDHGNLLRFARSLLIPNTSYNRQVTSHRKKRAVESVLPVQISIKKNQTIISAGSDVKPVHISILNEIQKLKSDRRTDLMALMAAILFVLVSLVFFSYLRRFTEYKVKIQLKDSMIMGVVTLIVVILTKVYLYVTDAAVAAKFGDFLPSNALLFAAPVAAGPMLVGLLITSGEVVWIFTAFMAVVLSVMVDLNFSFLVVTIIGGIAGARGVYCCHKRNDIYWAGIRTGLVNAVSVFAIIMLARIGETDLDESLLWAVPAGFIGGVISSLVAMMLVPLLESLFNVTTDVKLLELSSLNHRLMKEMIVRAPGTYHHSIAVGHMVESAAGQIGANALLAKVMAYYHDIGKMEHPQYFIENQRPGYNPHDHISPYMSKTILIAHVKDGAEMAALHKLGEPIIDGILQHHGTTLISYFYNKALAERDDEIDHVEESEFRYPGPRPQFKEAGLVMLADSIEAAARSIEEPTAARLTTLVKNIIHSKFVDGQLDECDLTLRDLSIIEGAFKKMLLSIYHQRIDYPHMKLGQLVSPGRDRKKSKKGSA